MKILKETIPGTAAILVIGVPLAALAAPFVPIALAGHTGDDAWMLLCLIFVPILGFSIGHSEASGGDSEYS